jgi:hypothetical protein
VLTDTPTPVKRAIETVAVESFGVLAGGVIGAINSLTERWDVAIHAKAGLAWPMPPALAVVVKHYDNVMLQSEWRAFMRGAVLTTLPARDPLPLRERLEPWPWQKARDELLELFLEVLPS